MFRKSMKKRKQEVERTSIAATALLALSAEGPVLSDDEDMPSVDELSSELTHSLHTILMKCQVIR